MGFLDALKNVLSHDRDRPPEALARAWGLDGEAADGDDAGTGRRTSEYDRAQWHKKMKRVLDGLPASEPEFGMLMTEARSLKFDPEWVRKCQVDEFLLMVRRAVADRHLTEDEQRKLDLARDLIGIPEPEAEVALRTVIAEAETFFGGPVRADC
jgi:hypothetical protein